MESSENYSFCGSEFWNYNNTWNTEHPQLSSCFSNTVMAWIPCLFMWLFSPIQVYYCMNRRNVNTQLNWLIRTKIIILASALLSCLLTLLHLTMFSGNKKVYPVDVLSLLVRSATLGLATGLSILNKRKNVRTSWVIFLFWLLSTIFWFPFWIGLEDSLNNVILYMAAVFSFVLDFFMEPMSVTENSSHMVERRLPGPLVRNKTRKLTVVDEMLFNERGLIQDEVQDEEGTTDEEMRNKTRKPTVVDEMLMNERALIQDEVQDEESTTDEVPYQVSFPSKLTFFWFFPFIWKGQKMLGIKDLWHLSRNNLSKTSYEKLKTHWNSRAEPPPCLSILASRIKLFFSNQLTYAPLHPSSDKDEKYSVLWPLAKAFGSTFLSSNLLMLCYTLIMFGIPELLRKIENFLADRYEITWHGYYYAALISINLIILTLLKSHKSYKDCLVNLRVQSALFRIIYRKALKVRHNSFMVGDVTNLLAVDVKRVIEVIPHLNNVWSIPVQLVFTILLLFQYLGLAIFASITIIVVLTVITGYITLKITKLQSVIMTLKDGRVEDTYRFVNKAKVCKMNFYESVFEEKLLEKREAEIKHLELWAFLQSLLNMFWNIAGVLNSLFSYLSYKKPEELKIGQILEVIALFEVMQMSLSTVPTMLNATAQAIVSLERINTFLNAEEFKDMVNHVNSTEEYPVTVTNGKFSYGDKEVLQNIKMSVRKKSLIGVSGTVGSGKSSLILGLLGEINVNNNSINITEDISFLSQPPFILNTTIQDNILFHSPMDYDRYDKVIKACYLENDIEILPEKHQTQAGEQGANLNGGLKLRVALARAIYKEATIYLLDDPFSALDYLVCNHILENVIGRKGFLNNKVRIVTANAFTNLPDASKVLILVDKMIKDGGNCDQNAVFYEFLGKQSRKGPEEIAHLKSELKPGNMNVWNHTSFPTQAVSETCEGQYLDESEKINLHFDKETISNNIKGQYLDELEKVEFGGVRLNVYKDYLQFNKTYFWLIILFYIGNQAVKIGTYYFMIKWVLKAIEPNASDNTPYIITYTVLGVISEGVLLFIGELLLRRTLLRTSLKLYRSALKGVVNTSYYSFFDSNPSGRIMARFTRDIDLLDYILPSNFHHFIYNFVGVVAVFVNIIFIVGFYSLLFVPFLFFYIFILKSYVATSRQLRHLESGSYALVYSHLSDSYLGAALIRVFKVAEKFKADFENKVDIKQRCKYPLGVANIWLGVWIEMVGNLVVVLTIVLSVRNKDPAYEYYPLTVIAVNYSFEIAQFLLKSAVEAGNIATNIVAVERIKECSDLIPEEDKGVEPPTSWPKTGDIKCSNLTARYPNSNICVLNIPSFHIQHGEKIGVMGSTGAGKTSLCLALLRMLNIKENTIKIDGMDISKVKLSALRSQLSIVPQDPSLFYGTLRYNLDPKGDYKNNDEALLSALEQTGLNHCIKKGLDFEIMEDGANLSVGERQLICLTRALLRKSKVIILDEATSAVDQELDQAIQNTIRENFQNSTILIVAHRITTIRNCDKIMIIKNGKVEEFGTPQDLNSRRDSDFYQMLRLSEDRNQPGTSRNYQ